MVIRGTFQFALLDPHACPPDGSGYFLDSTATSSVKTKLNLETQVSL
jgi:hypothetical protein